MHNQELKEFIRARLSWPDRNMTFRRSLRLLPQLLEDPGEQLVDMISGDMYGQFVLWVLTTSRLAVLEPFRTSQFHFFPGTEFVLIQNDRDDELIRAFRLPDPSDEDSVIEHTLKYNRTEAQNAARFVAMMDALASGRLFGKPYEFVEFMAKVLRDHNFGS